MTRYAWVALALLSAVSTPLVVHAQAPEDLPGIRNFSVVDAGRLYRGAAPTADGIRGLARMGMHTVVDLTVHGQYPDKAEPHDPDEARDVTGAGMAYVNIPMHEWAPTDEGVQRFLKVSSDPHNQPVFVHCDAGRNRTGLMAAAWRLVYDGYTLPQARAEMKRFHYSLWIDLPNYLARNFASPAQIGQWQARVALTPMPALLEPAVK